MTTANAISNKLIKQGCPRYDSFAYFCNNTRSWDDLTKNNEEKCFEQQYQNKLFDRFEIEMIKGNNQTNWVFYFFNTAIKAK